MEEKKIKRLLLVYDWDSFEKLKARKERLNKTSKNRQSWEQFIYKEVLK